MGWSGARVDLPLLLAQRGSRPAFNEELCAESVRELTAAFEERDYPGVTGYAAEKHSRLGAGDEAFEQARSAPPLAAVPVLDELHKRLWD